MSEFSSAVIQFPGSNCDRDVFTALERQGLNPQYIWHAETSLPHGLDLIVLPGGFSYGDYLRCGSMAARSGLMNEIKEFASRGGKLLGICNWYYLVTRTMNRQDSDLFVNLETSFMHIRL